MVFMNERIFELLKVAIKNMSNVKMKTKLDINYTYVDFTRLGGYKPFVTLQFVISQLVKSQLVK